MSNDYTDPAGESEMRRRAAWLLAMLALVAVLLVALMVMFLGGGSDKHGGNNVAFPTFYPTAPASSTSPPPSSAAPTHHGRTHHTRHPKTHSAAHSSSVSVPPHSNRHTVNCPGAQTCAANGDIGNAVAAVNDYRRQHGQSPVSGAVTGAAQQCAVSNGGNCSGSWSESQVPTANGHEAVQKILPFAHGLLDPQLSSVQVGWAYDPSAKQFYFSLIENG